MITVTIACCNACGTADGVLTLYTVIAGAFKGDEDLGPDKYRYATLCAGCVGVDNPLLSYWDERAADATFADYMNQLPMPDDIVDNSDQRVHQDTEDYLRQHPEESTDPQG